MLDTRTEIARGMRKVNERKGSKVPPPLGADAVHKCRRADCHPPYWPDGPPPNRKIGAKKEKALQNEELIFFLAETEGFEPSMRVLARMLP